MGCSHLGCDRSVHREDPAPGASLSMGRMGAGATDAIGTHRLSDSAETRAGSRPRHLHHELQLLSQGHSQEAGGWTWRWLPVFIIRLWESFQPPLFTITPSLPGLSLQIWLLFVHQRCFQYVLSQQSPRQPQVPRVGMGICLAPHPSPQSSYFCLLGAQHVWGRVSKISNLTTATYA